MLVKIKCLLWDIIWGLFNFYISYLYSTSLSHSSASGAQGDIASFSIPNFIFATLWSKLGREYVDGPGIHSRMQVWTTVSQSFVWYSDFSTLYFLCYLLCLSLSHFLVSYFLLLWKPIHKIPKVRDWWHVNIKHFIKEHGRVFCFSLPKSADWWQLILSWVCRLAQYSGSHIHEITYIIGHMITDQYKPLLAIFLCKFYHRYLKPHHYISNHVVNSHIYTWGDVASE